MQTVKHQSLAPDLYRLIIASGKLEMGFNGQVQEVLYMILNGMNVANDQTCMHYYHAYCDEAHTKLDMEVYSCLLVL